MTRYLKLDVDFEVRVTLETMPSEKGAYVSKGSQTSWAIMADCR